LGILNTNPAGRPNLVCNPNVGGAGTLQSFFNTSCFQTNPLVADSAGNRILVSNTVGNTARGNITGPRTVRFDITMVKNLRFGERFRFQFRAEAFNVFNNVNFRALQTNVTSAAFGQAITVRLGPRCSFRLTLSVDLTASFWQQNGAVFILSRGACGG
jgi:hypothetical protein